MTCMTTRTTAFVPKHVTADNVGAVYVVKRRQIDHE